MDPNKARAYVRDAIATETGKAMIRKTFPNDAATIIGTGGDAMDDDAIVQIAKACAKALLQTYKIP